MNTIKDYLNTPYETKLNAKCNRNFIFHLRDEENGENNFKQH